MIREKTNSLVHSKRQGIPLKRVAKLFAGHPFRGRIEHDPEGTISVVQLKNVDPVLGVNEKRLPKVVPTGRRRPTFLEEGDILFVNRGMRFFGALVDKPLEKTVAAPHFFIIKANSAVVRPDYLAWFLNGKMAQRYYSQCAAGTALPHITRRTLEALVVEVPPLERQALIAKVYQCHLRERELTERLINRRELLVSSLLEDASKNTK
ncbi:MAG: restriction endonuclease subunit S [Pseudodesulfovibrio sp.]|nr:restriction endonuclease subunit S [Pseudodesulfovibrio sp.]